MKATLLTLLLLPTVCQGLLHTAKRVPVDPPVGEGDFLATYSAHLYTGKNCTGDTATFDTSGNAFLKEFQPFIKNLEAVMLCGSGSFFYYQGPDMTKESLLGHVTRCPMGAGKAAKLPADDCSCVDLPEDTWGLTQSFSVQYC